MSSPPVSRLRIVTALLLALIVVSIVPLVISHVALVKINREALETAEKKYLTRSAVTLSQDVDTYLKNAQALGDMQTLRAHGLEVVRIEVQGPDDLRRLI